MKKTEIRFFIGCMLASVVLIGTLSMVSLMKFYIDGETDYIEWSPKLGSKFETDVASSFWHKTDFVDLNGAIRNVLHQQEMNEVIKLNNGYLTTIIQRCSDEKIFEFAENTATFNEYLKNRGTLLIYAQPPYTCSKYDTELPAGVEDYGNDNLDRMVEQLRNQGVSTIDFRETMHDEGINQYDLMYKTDHHWTTEAGFYAYTKLEQEINAYTGCQIDNTIDSIDNYEIKTYKNWHLGSRGQRTGKLYAGIDDFDLIIPKFDTAIEDSYGNKGTVIDRIIDMDALEKKDNTSRYTYDNVYGKSCDAFTNLKSKNDVTVLMISDSFSKVVNPYLIMQYKHFYWLPDQDVSTITPEYIEKINPDVVIMMYYEHFVVDDSKAYGFEAF